MSVELSHERLEQVRATLKANLESVPEGMHKPISPDVMDKLIFRSLPPFNGKVVEFNEMLVTSRDVLKALNSKLTKAKLPIWTGPFLSKVDLSGVSFEGAILDFDEIARFFGCFEKRFKVKFSERDVSNYLKDLVKCFCRSDSRRMLIIDENNRLGVGYFSFEIDSSKKANTYAPSDVLIDFSNTNVSVDPRKLFVPGNSVLKSYGSVDDFSALGLFNDDSCAIEYWDKVPKITYCSFANVDLRGVDLGKTYIQNTDLSNTGVAIKIDTGSPEFVSGARSCKLDGCLINGKLVGGKKIPEAERTDILSQLAGLETDYLNAFDVDAVPKHPKR